MEKCVDVLVCVWVVVSRVLASTGRYGCSSHTSEGVCVIVS